MFIISFLFYFKEIIEYSVHIKQYIVKYNYFTILIKLQYLDSIRVLVYLSTHVNTY
jgi:hypothetical protein